jgi:hypothetical protein
VATGSSSSDSGRSEAAQEGAKEATVPTPDLKAVTKNTTMATGSSDSGGGLSDVALAGAEKAP